MLRFVFFLYLYLCFGKNYDRVLASDPFTRLLEESHRRQLNEHEGIWGSLCSDAQVCSSYDETDCGDTTVLTFCPILCGTKDPCFYDADTATCYDCTSYTALNPTECTGENDSFGCCDPDGQNVQYCCLESSVSDNSHSAMCTCTATGEACVDPGNDFGVQLTCCEDEVSCIMIDDQGTTECTSCTECFSQFDNFNKCELKCPNTAECIPHWSESSDAGQCGSDDDCCGDDLYCMWHVINQFQYANRCNYCYECDPIVNQCADIFDPSTCQSPTPTAMPSVLPTDSPDIDCVGDWSECNDCEHVYNITTTVSGNGAACAYQQGDVETCDTDACANAQSSSNNDGLTFIIVLVAAIAFGVCCGVFWVYKCCMNSKAQEHIDSTKSYSPAPVNSTKKRIKDDIEIEDALLYLEDYVKLKIDIIKSIESQSRIQQPFKTDNEKRNWETKEEQKKFQQQQLGDRLQSRYGKQRYEDFLPKLNQMWEQARDGTLPESEYVVVSPDMLAQRFFHYFDYEGNGSFSLQDFAPVVYLVEESTDRKFIKDLTDTKLIFDTVRGDAEEFFYNHHVELFLKQVHVPGGKNDIFKLLLIKYLNTHTEQQSMDKLEERFSKTKKQKRSPGEHSMPSNQWSSKASVGSKREPETQAGHFDINDIEDDAFHMYNATNMVGTGGEPLESPSGDVQAGNQHEGLEAFPAEWDDAASVASGVSSTSTMWRNAIGGFTAEDEQRQLAILSKIELDPSTNTAPASIPPPPPPSNPPAAPIAPPQQTLQNQEYQSRMPGASVGAESEYNDDWDWTRDRMDSAQTSTTFCSAVFEKDTDPTNFAAGLMNFQQEENNQMASLISSISENTKTNT